jgi:hypothetical protein
MQHTRFTTNLHTATTPRRAKYGYLWTGTGGNRGGVAGHNDSMAALSIPNQAPRDMEDKRA